MVTQSKPVPSAGPSDQVTVMAVGQLSQTGIGETEKVTGFGFDWGYFLHFLWFELSTKKCFGARHFLVSSDRLGHLRHSQQIP